MPISTSRAVLGFRHKSEGVRFVGKNNHGWTEGFEEPSDLGGDKNADQWPPFISPTPDYRFARRPLEQLRFPKDVYRFGAQAQKQNLGKSFGNRNCTQGLHANR